MLLRFDDAVASFDQAATPTALQATWQAVIEQLGYFSFDYAFGTLLSPNPRSVLDLAPAAYISTLDWSGHYFEKGYQAVDPFTVRSLNRSTPWTYDEVFSRGAENARQHALLSDLHAVGIRQGLAIPLHSRRWAGAMQLGSSLSASEFAALDRETRPLVFLLSACFHERMAPMLTPMEPKPVLRLGRPEPAAGRSDAGSQAIEKKAVLTPRERECLLWAAKGKTSWEIAGILGIAEATVNNLLVSARRRLKVATRTQAVAKAILLGQIVP